MQSSPPRSCEMHPNLPKQVPVYAKHLTKASTKETVPTPYYQCVEAPHPPVQECRLQPGPYSVFWLLSRPWTVPSNVTLLATLPALHRPRRLPRRTLATTATLSATTTARPSLRRDSWRPIHRVGGRLTTTPSTEVNGAVCPLGQRDGILQQSRSLHVHLATNIVFEAFLEAEKKVCLIGRTGAQLENDTAESRHVCLH